MSDYLLKLHIENPGTIYHYPDGTTSPSNAGHVWYEVINPNGSNLQFGYGPETTKDSLLPVPGDTFNDDGSAYEGKPYFTVTFRITENQARTLENYGNYPEAYNFDKSHYHALTNSCVDYVWKALELIGMNPDGLQGDLRPQDNTDEFSNLRNPAFADGGLLMIESNHGQVVEHFNTEGGAADLYDLWWGTNAGYWEVPSNDDDADLPHGVVIVEPMTPSPSMDGSDYNQDGTSYQ